MALSEPLCYFVSLPLSIIQEPALCTFVRFKRKKKTQQYPRKSIKYPQTEMLRKLTRTSAAGISDTYTILHAVKVFQITLHHVNQSDFGQYNTQVVLKLVSHFYLIIILLSFVSCFNKMYFNYIHFSPFDPPGNHLVLPN